MVWYKTGTVSITSGQTSVTGVGTKFATNSRVGDGLNGPDGKWYEITNIASETVLGIYPAYAGATVTNVSNWVIAPLQGYNKDSADKLRAITDSIPLIDTKQDKNVNLTALSGLTGVADRLSYFTGAGSLSLAVLTAKARALLARTDTAGMQSELSLVPVTSTTDTTAGRLVTPGWLGLGDALPITSGQNYNTLTQPGEYFYASGTAPTNAPIVPAHFISVKGRGIYPYQEVRPIYGNDVYQRSAKVANPTSAAADWNTWSLSHTTSNSQLDPALGTGGLMSFTSNAAGEAFRFANGLQIALKRTALTAANNAEGSLFTTVSTNIGGLPVNFIAKPVIVGIGTVDASGGGWASVRGFPNTTAWGLWSIYNTSSSVSACTLDLVAIGRWK